MEKTQTEHVEDHDETSTSSIPGSKELGASDIEAEAPDTGLRVRKDGNIVLIPQPADDDKDPLNWSWRKKHLVLLTVAWSAFCADFTSAGGSAPIIVQSIEFQKSISAVNQTNSINVLMMALGGLVWVPMTNIIGRAPTMFWTNLLGFAFSIGTAASPNYETFFAMRALTGFFITSGQTISIAFIRDMFFFHERARKIGLWAMLYIASPFWGPMLGNFVLGGTHKWQDVFWVGVGVCGLQMIFIVCFLDETWYNRTIPVSQQPPRGKGFTARLSRIIGVWELSHRTTYYHPVVHSFKRYIKMLLKPAFFIICVAYLLFFMWTIGINITTGILFGMPRAAGGYGYSPTSIGYLYFSPVVGVFFGEMFGHFANDWLARRHIRKHGGVYKPEVRLWMIYVSAVFMIAGLILLGQALEHRLSAAAVVMGWGMHTFGIMITSVAVSAYALDSYPEAPAEVSGWSNFARAIGGFSVGYFQEPWGHEVGFDASFGTQAAIVGFSTILVVCLHRFGPWLRQKAGPVE